MGSVIKFIGSSAKSAALALAFVAVASASASHAASAGDAHAPFAWPASLAPFGNGYPNAGHACRRLGESPATADYLDHMAILVGCPGGADSASVRAMLRDHRGHVVGATDGVTLISVPTEGARGSAAPGHQSDHARTTTGCHGTGPRTDGH